MATYKKYTNKKGEATYYIRAYDGYDSAGKQIERCTKWKPSPGMTEKQIAVDGLTYEKSHKLNVGMDFMVWKRLKKGWF